MATTTETALDEELVRQLRQVSCSGATTADLVALTALTLNVPLSSVPVLAYLAKAFFVPLEVVLPLREDGGMGPFGRALQVLFWFSSLFTEEVVALPWDWDEFRKQFEGGFQSSSLQTVPFPEGSLQFAHPPACPAGFYARALFEVYVDKVEASDPPAKEIHARIRRLANHFQEMIWGIPPDRNAQKESLHLKFEYHRIEDVGPKYRVVCMAHALRAVRGCT